MGYVKGIAALAIGATFVFAGCSALKSADEELGYELVDGENGAKVVCKTSTNPP